MGQNVDSPRGLDWVSKLLDLVGLGLENWTTDNSDVRPTAVTDQNGSDILKLQQFLTA